MRPIRALAAPLLYALVSTGAAACARGDASGRAAPATAGPLAQTTGEDARPAALADASTELDAATTQREIDSAIGSPSGESPSSRMALGAGAGMDSANEGSESAAPVPPDMLPVPGGSFTMGSDSGGQEDEHPAHTVTLAPFWLDRTEVTNAQWDECVAAHACRPKSESVRAQHPDFNGPNQPVSGITWDDARGYCAWRGKRLPREAEYERAVRGDDGRRFPWGNDAPSHERTVFGVGHPEDVGSHPEGRGPYGHDDLAGNVWEWMADEYDPYAYRRPSAGAGTPGTCAEITATLDELRRGHKQGFTGSNPIPDECEHSIRGGAYNYDPFGLRSTNRVHHPGRYRIPMLGVRCAKDVVGARR